MKLSLEHRTDRALRVLRLLAEQDGPRRGRELAAEVGTSAQYLPHVVRPLVNAGWITSEPGPRGGYALAADLRDRTLLELIELMEGPTEVPVCVLRGGPCGDTGTCELHEAWQDARSALMARLEATPLRER